MISIKHILIHVYNAQKHVQAAEASLKVCPHDWWYPAYRKIA